MKRVFPFLLAVIMSIGLNPMTAKATHLAAMDLTLTCISGYDYFVNFVFYRDCSGMAAPTTVNIAFQCTSNPAYSFMLSNIPLQAGSGQEVTQNCSAMPTKCTSGSLNGFQEYIYQVQVTLPPCANWKIFWPGIGTFCCRNSSNTIANSTGQGAYIEATLNNLDTPCNSTPTFTNKPLAMLCTGQTQCYNHGAFDPEGDSLVYSLVTPFTGNGTYVSWIPPYTATQPFPSNPPITIDPVTGDICMTPSMNVISPMALKVEQWRTINGVPTSIGTLYRDLQVYVVTCNNQIPKLSGMDHTMVKGYDPNDTIYSLEVCVGDSVKFTMWGYDADGPPAVGVPGDPHKFSITWNNGIPQGDFTTYYNNTDSARANFIWKPHAGHISTVPKCFTATIKDGACPFNGSQTFSYCIKVRGLFVNIEPDTLLCKGESVLFTAVADPATVNYIWFLNGIPAGVPLASKYYLLNTTNLAPGLHTVGIQVNDGGITVNCPGVDQAFVTVVPLPKPDLGNDTTIYGNQPLTLDAGPGEQYIWSTGATTQQITVNTTGQYKVIVDGGLGTRCVGFDSIYVQFIIGIDDPEPDRHTSIWPNPSNGLLNIGFNQPCEPGTTISVFNSEGRCVMENIHVAPGSLQTSIRVNNLPEGIYLLKISTENESITHKFILTKR